MGSCCGCPVCILIITSSSRYDRKTSISQLLLLHMVWLMVCFVCTRWLTLIEEDKDNGGESYRWSHQFGYLLHTLRLHPIRFCSVAMLTISCCSSCVVDTNRILGKDWRWLQKSQAIDLCSILPVYTVILMALHPAIIPNDINQSRLLLLSGCNSTIIISSTINGWWCWSTSCTISSNGIDAT